MSTIVTGEYIFQLGYRFASYEELKQRLDAHSQANFVHYWRRDTRTVEGAIMKTARPIAKCLKYYSVRYACVHGGQKYASRGNGRRQTQSMRFDCPAFIMLRASKCGQYLEVIGVCNEHNHEISESCIRLLPQTRKLSPEIRAEVIGMLVKHVERKKIIDYVKEKSGKQITTKDLFNLKTVHLKQNSISRNNVKKNKIHVDNVQILPNKIKCIDTTIHLDDNTLRIVPPDLFDNENQLNEFENNELLIEQNQQICKSNELVDSHANEIEINFNKYDDCIMNEKDQVPLNESAIIEYNDFIFENAIETTNHDENIIVVKPLLDSYENLILPKAVNVLEINESIILETKQNRKQILNKKKLSVNNCKNVRANKKKHCKYCGINIKLAKKQLEILKAEKQKLIEETQMLRLTKQELLSSNVEHKI